jgi:hypothetical protein
MAELKKQLVARWKSKRGKHWFEVWHDAMGWTYRTNGGGGNLGAITEACAQRKASELLGYHFMGSIHVDLEWKLEGS